MHLATHRTDLLDRARKSRGGLFQRFDTQGSAPHKGWGYRSRLLLEQLEERNLLSGYTYLIGPAVNVSHQSQGGVQGTIVFDHNNPDRLFSAGILGTSFGRYSIDGGNTWQVSDTSNLPPLSNYLRAVADPFGNLFLTYFSTSHVDVVAWSTDFGRTFAGSVTVIGGNVGANPSIGIGGSDVPGEYTVWVSGTVVGTGIFATGARITALGQVGPFTTPQMVPGSRVGSQVGGYGDTKVGPHGEVLVSYQLPIDTRGPSEIFVNQNPDGLAGEFGPPKDVTSTNVGSFVMIPAQPTWGLNASADMAWDYEIGRIYLVYVDRPSVQSADTDIYLRHSDDLGVSWTDRLRVNDDTTINSQFNPAIAVDPTTGYVAVSWYDARNVPTNDAAEVWAAVSVDGGASFLPNVKISPGVTDARVNVGNFGSYDTMDFYGGAFYRIWGDRSQELPDNPYRDLPLLQTATARVQVGAPAGPYVTAHTPVRIVDPGVGRLRVTFNEPMDVKSFTVDKVASFTGPDGDISVNAVTVVPDTNDTQFDVTFAPQGHTGRYEMVLGPDIRNSKGVAMDQDFDGTPGENTDTYTARFAVSSFKVTGHTPNDYRFGPVSAIRVTFNHPVNSATFTPDQVVSFTGPGGAIPVQHISAVPGSGNHVFAVSFAPQTAAGAYSLVIGPNILDAFGSPMDQNENFVVGEDPGDRYTAGFRLGDLCLGPDGGGYTACVAPFEDYSIFGQPGTFTIIQGPVGDEADPVDLGPNTFTFYGHTYTGAFQLFVSSHGLITFGAGNDTFISADLTTSPPQAAIAVLWDQWGKNVEEPAVVGRFEDFDEGGLAHRLIIEWYQVQHVFYGGRPITFQAILTLNEGSATHFTINYFDLDTGMFQAFGRIASVGIKAAGTQGPDRLLVHFRELSPYVGNERALSFSSEGTGMTGEALAARLVAAEASMNPTTDHRSAAVSTLTPAVALTGQVRVPALADALVIDQVFGAAEESPSRVLVSRRAALDSVLAPWADRLIPDPWLA